MKAHLETEKMFMWVSSVILYLFPEQVLPSDSHYYIHGELVGGGAPCLVALFIAIS